MPYGRDTAKALATLERLLEIPGADLHVALGFATDAVADALRADKVDAFLYDEGRASLVAVGVSNQPLSALQRKLGLDVVPLANGGRAVHVFETGETFHTGRLDQDPVELRGPKEALRIRSAIGVPLDVGGARRGAMFITSQRADFFAPEDVRFAEAVARWVGNLAHRAELTEAIARAAAEQGRRAVADELITVLAHDLRNFIAPIDTRLKLLRRRFQRDGGDPVLIRELDLACRGLARLSGMVANMLDAARIDQGVLKMDVGPVDLIEVLEDSGATLGSPEHPVLVRAAEGIVVTGDADRIRQCVENLLSNALKFSPAGAPVVVEAQRRQRDGADQAFVDIIDEGPGIAPELKASLFQRFVTGGRGGLGLGLFLAKRIAELHEGDLTVESEVGRGTRFTLVLPCWED